MSPKLLVINPDQCMEVQFDQQITIGRDVFNALSLQDPELSRSHAIIFQQDHEVIIKDLKSRNGLYVRGERAVESTLSRGDEIILGATVVIYDPPETLDLESALSKRGRYLVDKRAARLERCAPPQTVTVFSPTELDQSIDALLTRPDATTFFSLESAVKLLQAFKEMDDAPDAGALCAVALRRAMEIVGGHRGVIMEADDARKQLKVRSIQSRDSSETILIAQPVLRIVLASEKCIFCPSVARDERFQQLAEKAGRPVHSLVAAPIMEGEELFGFIYLDAEDESVSYDYAALRSVYFLAHHLGSLLRARPTHFHKHAAAGDAGEKVPGKLAQPA